MLAGVGLRRRLYASSMNRARSTRFSGVATVSLYSVSSMTTRSCDVAYTSGCGGMSIGGACVAMVGPCEASTQKKIPR